MSQQGFNAIALSIPVFFLLIGLELWIERRERFAHGGKRLYRQHHHHQDRAAL